MVFTPLDIHNKEFRRVFRGYSEEEVDDFLDKIGKEYENLYKENLELKDHLDRKEDNIVKYKDLEETLKNTLVVAQQTAQDIKTNSQKEAELILERAKNQSEAMCAEAQREAERLVYQAKNQALDITTEAKEKVKGLSEEYERLVAEYRKYQAHCKALLSAQLELVQSESIILTSENADLWQENLDIAASQETNDVNNEEELGEELYEEPEYQLLRRKYEEENND